MTPKPPSKKQIFDEVHGFIGLTKKELDLLNNPIMQRLRRIRQLGTADLVYPGANHTRFSHSLGVLNLTNRIAEEILKVGKIAAEDLEELRIAALVHDIGHFPFSHIVEYALQKYYEQNYAGLVKKHLHETFTADLLASIELGIDQPESIGQIVTGKSRKPIFTQILHSSIDADRMDYLLRDSYHTGVGFGQFDVEQIIRNITVQKRKDENIIAFKKKAMNAIDQYIFARTFMYTTVYTHKTVHLFSDILEDIVLMLFPNKKKNNTYTVLPDKCLLPPPETILINDDGTYTQEQLDDFLDFDDHFLYQRLKNVYKILNKATLTPDSKDAILFDLVNRFINRIPIKLVWEKCTLLKETKDLEYAKKMENALDRMEDYLNTEWKSKSDSKLCFVTRPKDVGFIDELTRMNPKNQKGQLDTGSDSLYEEEWNPDYILIYDQLSGQTQTLDQVPSSVNNLTAGAKITTLRVFLDEPKKDARLRLMKEFEEQFQSYLHEE